jgi:hypothetical protein
LPGKLILLCHQILPQAILGSFALSIFKQLFTVNINNLVEIFKTACDKEAIFLLDQVNFSRKKVRKRHAIKMSFSHKKFKKV